MRSEMVVKRILVTGLCLCMVLPVSGCKSKKTAKTNEIPTVKWIMRGSGPKEMDEVMSEVNKTLSEKVGANLTMEYVDSAAYQEKMNTYMAASKYYDMAFAGVGNPVVNAASKGGVICLDELLKDVPELKNSIPDYAWEIVKYDGKIYGVPNLQVLPTARAAVFDPSYIKKYNFDISKVKCLDDVVPYLEIMKENESENFVPFTPAADGTALESFGYCNDYSQIDNIYFKKNSNGKWKASLKYELDEYKKQVKRINEFYKKGYISKDIVSGSGAAGLPSAVSLTVYKPGLREEFKAQGKDRESVLIDKPVINKCQTLTVIGKDAKYPKEAMKIMQELNLDKKLFNLLTLGIEGKHYEMVDENTYRYIGDKNTSTYWINAAWAFGNQFNSYVKEGADPDVWEQTEKYNESAELSPFAGFSINDKSIRTELAQMGTVINRYSVMNLGAEDPENYYDEFLAEMKKAGSDKIVAEYEKQVNEFMSKK